MNRILLMLLCTLSAAPVFAQGNHQAESKMITVGGLVTTQLALDSAALYSLPIQNRKGFAVTGHKGEVKRKVGAFKGILLADIIKRAGVEMENHKEQGKYYIAVTATDGYQVVFGYDELMYGADASAVYLLLEENGVSLSGSKTGYVIACPGDKVSGPRYIKWVAGLEVRKI